MTSIAYNVVDETNWCITDSIPSVKVCQPEKHFCSYCQSNSPDDMRGNCNACGAPRGNDKPHFRYAMNDGLASAEWVRQNLLGLGVVDDVAYTAEMHNQFVGWRI